MRFGDQVEDVDRFTLDIDPEETVARQIEICAFAERTERKGKIRRLRE